MTNDLTPTNNDHILILGGGVIGLSIAIGLLQHPIKRYEEVTIIAPDLPSLNSKTYKPNPIQGADESSLSSYASAWAGAHHLSDAKTETQLKRDQKTFEVLVKLEEVWRRQNEKQQLASSSSSTAGRPLVYVHQTEYWCKEAELLESSIDWYPNYKPIPKDELIEKKIDFGATVKTLDIDVPNYLPILFSLFLSLGGKAIKQKAKSVEQAIDLISNESSIETIQLIDGKAKSIQSSFKSKPSLVIASPGLGAKELLGDENVLPIRGQTVLLNAPWCTTEYVHGSLISKQSQTDWCGISKVIAAQGGYRDTYVIPRGDGTIICGGTRLENDFDVEPRIETSQNILKRVLTLMPQLEIPSNYNGILKGKQNNPHSGDYNVDIVAVNVGLRPGRKGGIRLEREKNDIGTARIPLIYCYGFGGIGYQSSWGAAFDCRELVDESLKRQKASNKSTLSDLDKNQLILPNPVSLIEKNTNQINGVKPIQSQTNGNGNGYGH